MNKNLIDKVYTITIINKNESN